MKTIYSIRVPEAPASICIADLDPPNLFGSCEHWHMARINVPRPARGNKYGSRLLANIIKEADAESAALCLDPASSGDMTTKDLIAWYERNGFVRTRNDRCLMIREPNGTGY